MDLKRKDKDGGSGGGGGLDLKRLAKFYASDRPPRKRLRTLLEFIKSPPGSAGDSGGSGNIAVAVHTLLSGAAGPSNNNKDAGVAAAEHVSALADFWTDPANGAMLFTVLNDCITELETLYSPHETAFRKLRKKPLEAEDWNEVFEGLEVLIRNNIVLIHEGWNNNGFTVLFTKLLKRDNHALIKKYAFRCLALYTDATRNLQQLAAISTAPLSAANGGHGGLASVMLMSEGADADGNGGDDNGRGTAVLPTGPRQKSMHLELLRESVDFSPYGGGSIMLPDKFLNEGVHVEGWMRPMPTQAEEPVDMLKFVMDLSLEREDPKIVSNPRVNHEARGDRFVFWCELIMKFYMPLLYPKICVKHKLKDERDGFGFFHHCPGSFQRVVARWIYKLRSKEEFMDVLWSRREFSEVVMETIRQRFAYRDIELVLDAIKFYSGICNGAQYAPEGMKAQMNESSRAMISHVSQLFHPSVILDDTKMLLHSIELLELISQRKLDDYTATYLRKFVVSTIDNCVVLREPNNQPVLSAMISVVLHVWMHAAISMKATGAQVWFELTVAMRRWLVNPNDVKNVGAELINCWKRELRFTSCLLMYVMDQGQSMLKVTIEGAVILPQSVAGNGNGSGGNLGKLLKDPGVKQGYIQSSATFLINSVHDVNDATLLLDRVLHLIPPPTVAALVPYLHVSVFEGLLQLVELWIDLAICSQRSTPTVLHQISPSTVIALFGEWFLPACELENPDYLSSRCLAIIILCKLCSVRCANPVTRSHLTVFARVLFRGVTSLSGVVVSTVLQRASSIFTLNLEGMNVLVPSFLHAIDQIIIQSIWDNVKNVKAPDWKKELTAALDVVFSIMALPKRFPDQNFVSWQQKFQLLQTSGDLTAMGGIMREVPDTNDDFHAILGRVLVRISDLPFADFVDIKKRALWGLYSLVAMNLKPQVDVEPVDRLHLTDWIVHLIDFCQATDFSISMTALGILQDLSDFHEEINALDSALIARIVMTLAVFAQQQVEEASIEVQSAIESLGPGALDSGDKISNAGAHQRISGNGNLGARRGSDNRPSRIDGNANAGNESNDPFSKLKNKLKPAGSAPLQVSVPNTPIPTSPAIQSPPKQKEHEIPALRLIVQKTSAIFECLRFWVMHRSEVLQDGDVRKLLFSAIEAALVGSLPDGEWQKEVERARSQERRMSMPLLFLGLQMRASLYNETSHAWLKFFEETAVAAEGLLMHLLHHINGFPSPAGVDQMVSNCAEFSSENEDAGGENGNGSSAQDKNASAGFSFVFMNSIVITVVGSIDSPCARFVARDMTGLFSWEIAPAVSTQSPSALLLGAATDDSLEANASSTTVQKRHSSADKDAVISQQAFRLHEPDAAVRVDSKQSPEAENGSSGPCRTCGGEKPRQKAAELASQTCAKLAVMQVPWEREEAILGNTLCPVKSTYVYHEDTAATATAPGSTPTSTDTTPAAATQLPNSKKKSSGSRSGGEVEKMPSTGNKDERVERLEKIARLHEERNNVGAHAPPQAPPPAPKKCECSSSSSSKDKRSRALSRASERQTVSVMGLFEMDEKEPNIGSLDNERCLLDLVLDSIPMVFRDGVGDTADKTLLGGRYAMQRYNLMDLNEATNPLVKDSADMPGFSFLQRLIHDEECYAQFKAFLTKEESAEGKELVDFCDAVKRYERSTIPSDRLGQASVIYWEFFTPDGAKKLTFPPSVGADVQSKLQAAQVAIRNQENEEVPLSGSLFQSAMAHIEYSFENSGLLDKYVASLDPNPASTLNGSASANGVSTANGKDASSSMVGGNSIPPQLGLFDSFSIMELNARISYLALKNRNEDLQTSSITKPRSATNPERLVESVAAGLGTSRVGALDICRLFLSQMGLLPSPNGDVKAKSYLKLLENGAKLERSLKHLDKSPVRETMKIGVIYVGRDQQTQTEILKNERGSKAYEKFLKQLGWEVDLVTHRGFVGGLDPNPKSLSNGKTTLYYANSHSEVVFHVVTKMPTKPSDPQQIDKKRHVGNDYVHVVWSDNVSHEYDPGTITSHFNDVQVVIYPLRKAQKGLFYVQIYSKEKVPLFGPLQSGMVVHERDLAQLVRQTAMNANRVCRSQTMIYVRPYPTRKKLVDEIVERYSVEYKESQLLTMLFANSASLAASGGLAGATLASAVGPGSGSTD
ncbi:hypothetical protein Gpo141_00004473 [Globisporangium polare]